MFGLFGLLCFFGHVWPLSNKNSTFECQDIPNTYVMILIWITSKLSNRGFVLCTRFFIATRFPEILLKSSFEIIILGWIVFDCVADVGCHFHQRVAPGINLCFTIIIVLHITIFCMVFLKQFNFLHS
jgi:hypothetical protein